MNHPLDPRRATAQRPIAPSLTRIAELEAQIADVRAQDARRHKEVEARIQELRGTMQAMGERLRRGSEEREHLKSLLGERAMEIDALRRDLETARDAAAAANQASAVADLASARDRIVRLTDRLRELESQAPSVAGRDPADQKLIERLESEVRRRDQALIVAAEKSAEQGQRIESLERKLNHARARIAEVRDALLAEKRAGGEGRDGRRPRQVDEILAAPEPEEEAVAPPPPPPPPPAPPKPAPTPAPVATKPAPAKEAAAPAKAARPADDSREPPSDASWVDIDGTAHAKGDDSSSWVDVNASQSQSVSESQSGTVGTWVALDPPPKKPVAPPEAPTPHAEGDERMTGVRVPPRRPEGFVSEESISVEDDRGVRSAPRREEPAPQSAQTPAVEDRAAGMRVPPRRTVSATETSIVTEDMKSSRVRAKSRPVIEAPVADEPAPPPGAPPCFAGLRAEGVVRATPLGARWPARDQESRQPVEVLLFARPLSNAEARRLDAMLLARHPNIACALSTATAREGQYVVFERSSGETLEDWVRRTGPLPERAALPVALQIARALRQAAFHGAIHGDLSPNCVRVEATGHLQVEDVGVGALYPGPDRPVLAAAFSSPERLRGSPPPDARSDIYSLGALLFYLLTGGAPHDGDRDQVVRRVAIGATPDPRERRPDVSADTAKLVMKMMSADPDRRQATWDQALVDLERRIPGERSEDLRGNLKARVFAAVAEHPYMVFGGLVAPVLIVAAGLFFSGDDGPTARARFDAAVREADALVAQGDVEGARLVIGRFLTGVGDPAVEREAAARIDFLKSK